jgi:hypothetical protein
VQVDLLVEGLHVHHASGEVDRGRAAENEIGVRAHDAERYDNVARLQSARGGLREQRREEHRVLRADDRGAALAEVARDPAAGEAAADHESSAAGLALAHASTIAAWRGFRSR